MDELEHERQELLAAMMRAPDPGLEPGGSVGARGVIHEGDSDYPAPVVSQTFSSAGYVMLYDTKSRVPSVTNRNMLAAQLKKKHKEDGTPMYTTVKPMEPPLQGGFKCYLHEDDPNRAQYDAWGFARCTKANLVSAHERDIHMQHRHKKEWATVERERKETREREDREFQRAWMDAIGAQAGVSGPRRSRTVKEPELATANN